MDLYLKLRCAHFHDGLSGRAIARGFGICRDRVAKMLAYSEPPGYQRTAPIKRPKEDAFTVQIDIWLPEDKGRPRKQRHTAKRIFDRLRSECDFTGGYTIVKHHVRSQKRGGEEMFVPLSHPAGHAQEDFGEALVVIGGVEQKAYFFAFDLPQSDACYIRAYPSANTKAWLVGHVHAFAFFEAVPQSILYDNDRCLVAKIMPPSRACKGMPCRSRDGVRKRTQRFSAMLSHFVIDDRYGRPGKGNDKGKVEGLVGYARRNFKEPMPRFFSWDAFNDYLEEQCLKRQGDILQGHKVSIGARLDADLAAMQALPAAPFEACDPLPGRRLQSNLPRGGKVDKLHPVQWCATVTMRCPRTAAGPLAQNPALANFLREHDKQARICAAKGLEHVRYLPRLTELERIDRERRMVERRIKSAKFPAVKSLDGIAFKAIPSLNKMMVQELARCDWIERRENVIALGPSGTGKTHIALGLGLAAS